MDGSPLESGAVDGPGEHGDAGVVTEELAHDRHDPRMVQVGGDGLVQTQETGDVSLGQRQAGVLADRIGNASPHRAHQVGRDDRFQNHITVAAEHRHWIFMHG